VPPWVLPVVAAPFVGSFLGVVIRRLPSGRPIIWDRSRCEACGAALGAAELVPVASYVIQRGRCRRCGAQIATAHLLVELAATAIAIWAAMDARVWWSCGLGWTLLALAWIDMEHLRLPDALTLPLVLGGLAAALALDPAAAPSHAAAAAIGYLAFSGLAAAYRALRKREGLGGGDAKLLAAAGAWVGMAGLPTIVVGGAVMTLAATAMARLGGRTISGATRIPLGPGLCAALWLVWLYGGL